MTNNYEDDFFKKKNKGRLIILKNKETYSKPNNNKTSNKTEIVFKKISSLKSINNIKTLFNYLQNNGNYELYDSLGKIENLDEKLEYLDLVKDEDNLKTKYKNKVSKIEEKHLFKNQGYHFIISYPNNKSVNEKKVTQATIKFLGKQYLKGYDGLYAIHKHQKNLHAHVFMTAKNKLTRKNIEMRKANLYELRYEAYECAKEFGIDVTCTRREFRKDLVEDIKSGKEPLRKNYKEKKKKTVLERKVPAFAFKNHAFLVALKLKNELLMKKFYQKIDLYEQLQGYQQERLDEHFSKYKKPDMAKNLYLEMLCENKKTANWYLINKPNMFSQIKENYKKEDTAPNFYINENDVKRLKEIKDKETLNLNLSKFNPEIYQLTLYQKIKTQEKTNKYLDKVHGMTKEEVEAINKTDNKNNQLSFFDKLVAVFSKNKEKQEKDKTEISPYIQKHENTNDKQDTETKIDKILSKSIKSRKVKDNNERNI